VSGLFKRVYLGGVYVSIADISRSLQTRYLPSHKAASNTGEFAAIFGLASSCGQISSTSSKLWKHLKGHDYCAIYANFRISLPITDIVVALILVIRSMVY
jgi:hypothetical protein